MVAAAVAHKSALFIPIPLSKGSPRCPNARHRLVNAVAPHLIPALHAFFWVGDTQHNPKTQLHCFFGTAGAVKQHSFLFAMQREEELAKNRDMT
jgi:hypothetical protein